MSTQGLKGVKRVSVLATILAVGGILQAASFQGLGFLSSEGLQLSGAYSVSADGSTVIGSDLSTQGIGFVWTRESGKTALGGVHGSPYTVSADGSLIAGSITISETIQTPVVWGADRQLTELPTGSRPSGQVKSISSDGSILVGEVGYRPGGTFEGKQACYWDSAYNLQLITLPGSSQWISVLAVSPDASKMAIYSYSGTVGTTYLGSVEDGFSALSLGSGMHISRFSGDGRYILGTKYLLGSGTQNNYLFRWSEDEGVEYLDQHEEFVYSTVFCSNAEGSMIGGTGRISANLFDMQAFLWQEGKGTQLLVDVLTGYGLDMSGWHLGGLTGISDDGTVLCGWGINPQGFEEAWVATIPEPATFMLLAIGALALNNRTKTKH